jgi:hypothetical protein
MLEGSPLYYWRLVEGSKCGRLKLPFTMALSKRNRGKGHSNSREKGNSNLFQTVLSIFWLNSRAKRRMGASLLWLSRRFLLIVAISLSESQSEQTRASGPSELCIRAATRPALGR